MKKSALLGMCLAAILSAGTLPASAQSHSPSTQWHWNKGKIMIDSPERPAGQKDVIGLTLPKMKTVRVGFVGLGMRGPDAVADFALLPGVEIVALCDFEEPRAAKLNALFGYIMNILMALMMLSTAFVMISMSAASASRIVEVLDETTDLPAPRLRSAP